MGACSRCEGLGIHLEFDEERIIPDPRKSLIDGAIAPWGTKPSPWYMQTLKELYEYYNVSMEKPWKELSTQHKKLLLYGSETLPLMKQKEKFEE